MQGFSKNISSPSFVQLLKENGDWLHNRGRELAKRQGLAECNSKLDEVNDPELGQISAALQQWAVCADQFEVFTNKRFSDNDPCAQLGINKAKKYRLFDSNLPASLGLIKTYRQCYQELVFTQASAEDRTSLSQLINHGFDRMEIAFVAEWSALDRASYNTKEPAVSIEESPQKEDDEIICVRSEEELIKALAKEQFFLEYQPMIAADSGRVVAAEALIRWNHPEHGLVGPNEFIPFAGETGLIEPIGRWVVGDACKEIVRWRQGGLGNLKIAINIDSCQMKLGLRPDYIARMLDDFLLSPDYVKLEFTEQWLLEASPGSRNWLKNATDMGFTLSLDNFGTGYSSIGCMRDIVFDEVKIDRSLIRDIENKDSDLKLVKAIVSLAHNLGVKIVAAGVETEGQEALLRNLGCHYLQGFLYKGPLQGEEFFSYAKGLKAY